MSKPFTVFYGSQVYGEYDLWKDFRLKTVGEEVYNGAYVYLAAQREWYRMDATPVPLEDVPKVQRMLALVLNL